MRAVGDVVAVGVFLVDELAMARSITEVELTELLQECAPSSAAMATAATK